MRHLHVCKTLNTLKMKLKETRRASMVSFISTRAEAKFLGDIAPLG